MKKSVQGYISIFLALISLPLYSMAILSIDLVKILSAKNDLLLANEVTSHSLLANYDRDFYEKYNIFAISKDKEYLNYYAQNLLDLNLSKGNKYNIVGLESSQLDIDESDKLMNTPLFEKQILDHMSLNGPYDLSKGALKLLNLTKDSKKYGQVLEKKYDFEEEYSNLKIDYDKLSSHLVIYKDNFQNLNDNILSLNQNLNKTKESIKEKSNLYRIKFVLLELEAMEEETINLESQKLLSSIGVNTLIDLNNQIDEGIEADETYSVLKSIGKYKDQIELLNYYRKLWSINEIYTVDEKEYKLSSMIVKIINWTNSINKQIKDELENILEAYRINSLNLHTNVQTQKSNYKAIIDQLVKFNKATKDSQDKMDIWKNEIYNLENSDVKNNFISEYKSFELEFSNDNISSLLNKLQENYSSFDKYLSTLLTEGLYNPDIGRLNLFMDTTYNLEDIKKLPALGQYKVYKILTEVGDRKEAPIDSEIDFNIKDLNKLSGKKDDVVTKEGYNLSDFIETDRIQAIVKNDRKYNFDLPSVSNFNNYKNIVSDVGHIIPEHSTNLLDNAYISMYILDNFNSKIDNSKDFSSQIEYILFGNENLGKNESSIQNMIFAIRFLLNSVYAYTNNDLGNEASIVAATLAGWTGFGVPLVRTLVLSGMSFGESLIDVNTLNKSKDLAGFKNKSTWQVSLSGLKNLLAKNVVDISSAGIDSIYRSIDNYADLGIDQVQNKIDEFTNQTIDGLSQSIISQFISPIQITIIDNINKPYEILIDKVEETFNDISSNYTSDNEYIDGIKSQLLIYIKNEVYNLLPEIEVLNIEEKFSSIISSIESKINDYTSGLSKQLKAQVSKTLAENKDNVKIKLNSHVEEYLGKLTNSNSKMKKDHYSGISFNYEDYLFVLTLFRLSSADKSQILNRMLLIMEDEIRKKDSNFDITQLITGFNLSSTAKVNTSILNNLITIEKIEDKKRGEY